MSTIEKRDEAIDLARYKQAAEEIETGNRDDALWYKAFADGGGDENATKAAYIRLRVEQLRRAAVAASAVRVTATQPSPAYTPATSTARPKPNGAKSLYDVLGIAQGANDEQILAGYQTQKNILDARENQDAETKNSLIFIQHAKEVLLDPAKRAAYDARITAEAAQPEKVGREKSSGSRPTSASEPLNNRDLYAAYLGEKNQDYYLNRFEEFDRRGDGIHASLNPNAILFFGLWTLYRKMYGWFLINVIAFVILSAVSAIIWEVVWKIRTAPPYLLLLYFVLMGVFADTLYHKHVKKKIAAAKTIARNDNELIESLKRKGGIHAWVIWVVLATFIIGIIAAIAIPAYSDYTKKAKAQIGGNVPQATRELPNPLGQGVSYDQNDPPFKEANSLYAAGKYTEAIEIWHPLAEQGNARAQYAMGAMYSQGKGVAENHQEAVKWYRLAAEQGHAKAQLFLGMAYAQGQGVIEDKQEAVKWYRLAAKQGNSDAQGLLGLAYDFGSVPLDKIKAHMWYSIAAAIDTDARSAQNQRENRDRIERVMSPNDITRSQQMARECMNSNYENCD